MKGEKMTGEDVLKMRKYDDIDKKIGDGSDFNVFSYDTADFFYFQKLIAARLSLQLDTPSF